MSLSMAQAAIRCVRAVKARALGVRAGLPRRTFRMTRPRWGLDEFFYSGPAASGESWSEEVLRKKSVEDLHKLWFVLVKERNMLYTRKYDCFKRKVEMEGQNRIKKVQKSMRNIKKVLGEREREAIDRVIDDLMQEHNLKSRKQAMEMLPEKPPKKYPHPYPTIPEAAKYIS
ncbi:hypothetical protein AAMO2058_000730700 [Amorphochlora amoebiformis]